METWKVPRVWSGAVVVRKGHVLAVFAFQRGRPVQVFRQLYSLMDAVFTSASTSTSTTTVVVVVVVVVQ